jgi:hypothetical protein
METIRCTVRFAVAYDDIDPRIRVAGEVDVPGMLLPYDGRVVRNVATNDVSPDDIVANGDIYIDDLLAAMQPERRFAVEVLQDRPTLWPSEPYEWQPLRLHGVTKQALDAYTIPADAETSLESSISVDNGHGSYTAPGTLYSIDDIADTAVATQLLRAV